MKQSILAISFLFSLSFSWSQTVLTEKEYYEIILLNHPIVQQAGIKPKMGERQLLKAKGGFDPKLFSEFDRKNYNSVTNYQKMNAGLSIPTWYGIQVKSGVESNSGPYLSPESKTPAGGLWYGGISVSLGQGMMIDQRRAELFKSRIYQESTRLEQRLLLNELVYESGSAYWDWFLAHYSKAVLQNSYELALVRLQGVKKTAELGDRPIIDTVEARIQVQYRQSLLNNYQTDLLNAKVKLETFLWTELQEPLELDDTTLPLELDSVSIAIFTKLSEMEIDSLAGNHPYLNMNNLKIKSLEIDQKLKKEQLKPNLNLSYNFINEPINYNPITNLSPNNNKIGVQLEMPILFRKERGEFELAKLKVQDERLTLLNNQAYIKAKIKQAQNDAINAQNQLDIYRQTVLDSRQLFEAERSMFEQGESSLFLVNARELAFIQAKLKYLEVLTKCQKAVLSYEFSLARLIP
jgi:outer membrane protein TolC